MNEPPRSLNALKSIDLAAEDDFSLGGLSIFPSLREVRTGGRRETVEPRVMQVLVALARMDGAVVSRDQLIERCWGGRLVGDDAINSCVAKVRALAALVTPPAFEVETIPRVGYRLHAREAHKEPAAQPQAGESSRSPERQEHRIWPWTAAAGAGVAVLVAVLAWWFLKSDGLREWTVVESRQPFIGTSLIERYPALSPDGTMLAYSAGPNLTSRQIYLRLIKGDSSIQLTHEAFDAISPAWSPDGTTIAYSVFQSGHPCRIMEMEIPSGEPHQVGRCRTAERAALTFYPLGRALVFADSPIDGAPKRLVELDTETGQIEALTDPPKAALGDDEPSFSPDGGYLVYDRWLDDTQNEIRLRKMSDGSEHVVDTLRGCEGSLAWTPDGTAILVARSCAANYSLLAYSPNGGKPWQIMTSASSIGRLSVNANGYVAMETTGGHAPVLAFRPNSGQPPVPLDDSSGLTTFCADFAPDGTLIATGRVGDAVGIWIANKEGAPFRKLMSLTRTFACAIRWSPDGTRFAFIEWGNNGFDVPVVSRSGEVIRRLHYGGRESRLLEWTADGKSILTSRIEKEGWRIWRTDLTPPFKSVPVTPFGWADPRVHGSMLFAEKADVVGTWRLDKGAPVRVADGPTPESSDLVTISGDQLYFADLTDSKHPAIAAQSVYGGEKKRLIPLPFGTIDFTFAVNPKSGDIVFSPPASDDSDIGLVRLQRR